MGGDRARGLAPQMLLCSLVPSWCQRIMEQEVRWVWAQARAGGGRNGAGTAGDGVSQGVCRDSRSGWGVARTGQEGEPEASSICPGPGVDPW